MGFRVKAAIFACLPLAAAAQDMAQDGERLIALINGYRTAPGVCEGHSGQPAPPLAPEPTLSAIRLGTGAIVEAALDSAGYVAELADAVFVGGADSAKAAMEALQKNHCATLLSPGYAVIGAYRQGADWTVILARPAPPPPSQTFPDWRDAGLHILAGVNLARAEGRTCGKQPYPPAPPLRWNAALGTAALAHSQDMAAQRYFNHLAKDGSLVGARSVRAGYAWRRIGENIGFGQNSPQDALDGWLSSPGHCANIMNPDFTEMGAAYGMTAEQRSGIVYWTQVLGKPR
jgi:uncharacterized protein YkwD